MLQKINILPLAIDGLEEGASTFLSRQIPLTWEGVFKPKIPGLGGVLERVITSTFRRSLEGLERHSLS